MPPRNLLIIALTIIIALACYSMASKNRYANLFAEAMEVVEQQSLHVIPPESLFVSAMDGMMDNEEFDDHSMFISGDMFTSFDEDMKQEFGGVGMYVEVDPDTNQLCVLAPMPNTPAMESGLRVGDQIVTVDGVATLNLRRREALKLLRGPVGKPVELEIDRAEQRLSKKVNRKIIPVASVHGDSRMPDGSWNFTLQDNSRIGYIRLLQFGEKSADEIRSAIRQLGGSIDGLILDLRNNSGGLLDVAIEICDMFLPPDQLIVSTLGRNKKPIPQGTFRSSDDLEMSLGIPICVLIDRHSASASEIVAGCLQDHARAIIIGEQSWGKGTVQNVIPIQRGQSALKLTTASYWRPSGKNIDRDNKASKKSKIWGVQPNQGFAVELTEKGIIDNLRHIGIRELQTLVTPKELEYIRRVKQMQVDLVTEEAANTEAQRQVAPSEDSEGEGNAGSAQKSQIPEPVEPHVDLPLQRAIDYIRGLVVKESLIAA